ncbi:MAG: DNA-directed DNA polymerase II small subunit [Candidatus Nanoarchaeia archaeon]|nr:DNA-directed DNA polymerase II small subunit [Candidatus Nanoarchaeia archaeon]
MENQKEKIDYFIEKGFLISPELLDKPFDDVILLNSIKNNIITKEKPLILTQDVYQVVSNKGDLNINWIDFEKSKTLLEKGRDSKIYNTFLDILDYNTSEEKKEKVETILEEIKEALVRTVIEKEKDPQENSILILKNYVEVNKKREIQDFVSYFKVRYEGLKKILMNRVELQNAVSINKLKPTEERQEVAIIGIVSSKSKTKNENIILTLEDTTGTISVLFNKNKPELCTIADDIVLDEVIGIKGNLGDKIVFANSLFMPDVTDVKQKKSEDEAYAVFTSDIHMGLKNFLADDFMNFIKWLNQDYGDDEQKEIAKKVKYLFLVGDMVDGVGVYPGQEKDLVIKDVFEQYRVLAEYLSKIPKEIKIIICAGNHDAVRVAEPQPVLDKKIAKPLYDLENVTIVTNPSVVNIHAARDFPGFNVLLYHGFSIPHYADAVNSIRLAGGQDRADLIMKFYLQRRHFAPTHASNTYIPDPEQDYMLIDKIPDILATGHVHKVSTMVYKGINCINCSCWAARTEEQARRGINPDPSKVILANLKTREIKILNFGK